MTKECNSWLIGLIKGDGYTNDRRIEIYNSSESILKTSVEVLRKLISDSRIKVDIYSELPKDGMKIKWSKILNLPLKNFILRTNTSPWKARTEKIRLRVSSKEVVQKLSEECLQKEAYLRGLFDAEASVDIKGYIEFKQLADEKGKAIVSDVYKKLQSIDIETTTVKIKNDRNIKKDAYLYVKDLKKYQKLIGFVDEIKTSKLSIIIEAKRINNDPKVEIVQKMISDNKNLWNLVEELKSPYHKIRKALKDNHLAIRQTR